MKILPTKHLHFYQLFFLAKYKYRSYKYIVQCNFPHNIPLNNHYFPTNFKSISCYNNKMNPILLHWSCTVRNFFLCYKKIIQKILNFKIYFWSALSLFFSTNFFSYFRSFASFLSTFSSDPSTLCPWFDVLDYVQ